MSQNTFVCAFRAVARRAFPKGRPSERMVGKSEVDFWFACHPLADAYLFDSSKGDA